MYRRRLALAGLIAQGMLAGAVHAGDPQGVTEAMQALSAAWPEAAFSIDVAGTSNGQAVVDQPINIEYEAALPGYVTYLRISSHGDMTLTRDGRGPDTHGIAHFTTTAPLGNERLVVLFSSTPLNALFPGNDSSVALGADRDSAAGLVRRLNQLDAAGVKLVARRYHYEVITTPGGTEYTTRGITFRVLGSAPEGGDANVPHPACPTASRQGYSGKGTSIPAHIQFEFDSDRLTAQGRLDLDEFGAALDADLKDSHVVLQGNTDAVGSDDYNMALSERRALAARKYLQDSFAIASARLAAIGLGKSNPLAPNDSDADRACNRRVDFIISRPSPRPTQ